MRKIIKQLLRIILIISIIEIILSLAISQDTYHIETCKIDNCSLCAIIHISQALIKNFCSIAIISITSGYIIHFILSKIKQNDYKIKANTLILEKVELDE